MSCLPALRFRRALRVVGINSGVRHRSAAGAYRRTRCAAFIGHRDDSRNHARDGQMPPGANSSAIPCAAISPISIPTTTNVSFAHACPNQSRGGDFIAGYGARLDPLPPLSRRNPITPSARSRSSCAGGEAGDSLCRIYRAGVSTQGYVCRAPARPGGPSDVRIPPVLHDDAMLGAAECDLLVKPSARASGRALRRTHHRRRQGGTVAVFCDNSTQADDALRQIMADYEA